MRSITAGNSLTKAKISDIKCNVPFLLSSNILVGSTINGHPQIPQDDGDKHGRQAAPDQPRQGVPPLQGSQEPQRQLERAQGLQAAGEQEQEEVAPEPTTASLAHPNHIGCVFYSKQDAPLDKSSDF